MSIRKPLRLYAAEETTKMQTTSTTLTMTESEAYRLRTVLNYVLKGQDISINGVDGRRVEGGILINMKENK